MQLDVGFGFAQSTDVGVLSKVEARYARTNVAGLIVVLEKPNQEF